MKSIFIVLLFSTAALAGIVEPSLEEIQEAMRLWQKICTSGKTEGKDGSSYIFCKTGKNSIEEEKSHEINVTPSPNAPRQIIFIQAPPYVYKHNLALRGPSAPAPKTQIFVLPPRAKHIYDYQDTREVSSEVKKPHLYFLKDDTFLSQPDSQEEVQEGSVGSPQVVPLSTASPDVNVPIPVNVYNNEPQETGTTAGYTYTKPQETESPSGYIYNKPQETTAAPGYVYKVPQASNAYSAGYQYNRPQVNRLSYQLQRNIRG